MHKIFYLAASTLLAVAVSDKVAFADPGPNSWTAVDIPITTTIENGPWTLGQGNNLQAQPNTTFPSVGYCNPFGNGGVTQSNSGQTSTFQPYYFPYIVGRGKILQGYFDWRPKDSNEAIIAAYSKDAGATWKFQQERLELNPGLCPTDATKTNAQSYPNSGTDEGYQSGNDAGQGHPFVMTINGKSFLYTLDRTSASAQILGLVIHQLNPSLDKPLRGTPPVFDVTTTTKTPPPPYNKIQPQRTTGLLNPDGILAEVPGSSPRIVIYIQKQLKGDVTDPTALPMEKRCAMPPKGANQAGKKPNTDTVTVRLAKTYDGKKFRDIGKVNGLNDSTSVSWNGTRYISPRGTLLRLGNNRFGLFFAGGNCLDADSDGFHYIGYAESSNLLDWTVINGLNNPIASVAPITVDSNDEANLDQPITIPANIPIVGNSSNVVPNGANNWFAERVYAPNALRLDNKQIALIFAGYNTKGPSSNYSNYRTISKVILNSAQPLFKFGNGEGEKSDNSEGEKFGNGEGEKSE